MHKLATVFSMLAALTISACAQMGGTTAAVPDTPVDAAQSRAIACYAGAAVIQEANAAMQVKSYSPAQIDKAKLYVQSIATLCSPGYSGSENAQSAVAGLALVMGLDMPVLPALK